MSSRARHREIDEDEVAVTPQVSAPLLIDADDPVRKALLEQGQKLVQTDQVVPGQPRARWSSLDADLKAIEKQAVEITHKSRSITTKKAYARAYGKMVALGVDFEDYKNKRRSTYYFHKAAYQLGVAREARLALKRGDEGAALDAKAKLDKCDPDYAREHRKDKETYEIKDEEGNKWKFGGKKRKGRQAISGLPDDWRQLIVNASTEKYRTATIVSALAGCRPAELKGTKVVTRDDFIQITIPGSKTGQGHGQPSRTITLAVEGDLAVELHQKTQGSPEGIVLDVSGDAYAHSFRRAAGRALGRSVNAYGLRHQFSSDLKANLYEKTFDFEEDDPARLEVKVQIAKGMGHSSVRSQQHYGHSNQARGGGGKVTSVSGSRPVNTKSKKDGSGPSHGQVPPQGG